MIRDLVSSSRASPWRRFGKGWRITRCLPSTTLRKTLHLELPSSGHAHHSISQHLPVTPTYQYLWITRPSPPPRSTLPYASATLLSGPPSPTAAVAVVRSRAPSDSSSIGWDHSVERPVRARAGPRCLIEESTRNAGHPGPCVEGRGQDSMYAYYLSHRAN